MYFYRESLSVTKKFVQDNRGSVTIEFVIWLPFIGALLTFFCGSRILVYSKCGHVEHDARNYQQARASSDSII